MVGDCLTIAPRAQQPVDLLPYHVSRFPDGTSGVEFYRAEADYLLRFPDLADFTVTGDGSSAICCPALGVTASTTEHLYLNQVHPLMLSKRRELVFHASAVEMGEVAVAFVGVAGRGKSTLAAAFSVSGYRFLTDDGLWLRRLGDAYLVHPSHPSIRLWDDSRETLLGRSVPTAPPVQHTDKGRFLAGAQLAHCGQPRALRAACFLGDGSAQHIVLEALGAANALMHWLDHAFLIDVEDRSLVRSQFEATAALANTVPCFFLDYPRQYALLESVIEKIVQLAAREICAP